ncbi:hypothetical protein BC830DRAFT_253022 [Chytriomyces sp. MP71]|nr:hypothetical protein BC830DRAFT_253022 [Chytriomyces sp. MP71]
MEASGIWNGAMMFSSENLEAPEVVMLSNSLPVFAQLRRFFSPTPRPAPELRENVAIVADPLCAKTSLLVSYALNLGCDCVLVATRKLRTANVGFSPMPREDALDRIHVKFASTGAALRRIIASLPCKDPLLGTPMLPGLIAIDDFSSFFDPCIDPSENVRFTLALLRQTVQVIRDISPPGSSSSQCHFVITDLSTQFAQVFESIHSSSSPKQSNTKKRKGWHTEKEISNQNDRISCTMEQIYQLNADWIVPIQGRHPSFCLHADESALRKSKREQQQDTVDEEKQRLKFHFRLTPPPSRPVNSSKTLLVDGDAIEPNDPEWEDVGDMILLDSVMNIE